jgi:hypothetical protein
MINGTGTTLVVLTVRGTMQTSKFEVVVVVPVGVMNNSRDHTFVLDSLDSISLADNNDTENTTNGATLALSTMSNNRPNDNNTLYIDNNSDDNGNQPSDEHQSHFIEPNVPITKSTMIYVLCAALNSCNLGYDIGVSTNVGKLIQNDLHITNTQREIWIGFINFWASTFITNYHVYI